MAGKRRAEGPPSTTRPSRDENEPKSTKQRLLKVGKWAGIAFLVLSLIAVGGFIVLYRSIDIPNPNSDFQTETSHIYYADGKSELGRFATQNRDSVGLDDMSQDVKDAVVAAENQTFWTDKGIDPKGILRAAFSNASGNSTQGASTITQQYVKILYLTQEQSYQRKVKEAILSLKIQRQQSKEEILEGYLNTIYFGRGAYGVEAAAQAYFETSAKDLNLRQSAVLASVLNNPTSFDPANGRDNKKALKERYDYALGNMADLGNITEEESEKAQKRLPPFPKITAEDTYGGQQRSHAEDDPRRAARARVHRRGDRRRRARGDHHVRRRHHEGRRGRRAGRQAGRLRRQAAAHRRGVRRARHRCGARLLRRPGLPRLPAQLGGLRRPGRVDVQAVRAGDRAEAGLLAQVHLRGQLPDRGRAMPRSRTRATPTTGPR